MTMTRMDTRPVQRGSSALLNKHVIGVEDGVCISLGILASVIRLSAGKGEFYYD